MKKYELVNILMKIREDWTQEDLSEAGYGSHEQMEEAILLTYARGYIAELIVEEGHNDDTINTFGGDTGVDADYRENK